MVFPDKADRKDKTKRQTISSLPSLEGNPHLRLIPDWLGHLVFPGPVLVLVWLPVWVAPGGLGLARRPDNQASPWVVAEEQVRHVLKP